MRGVKELGPARKECIEVAESVCSLRQGEARICTSPAGRREEEERAKELGKPIEDLIQKVETLTREAFLHTSQTGDEFAGVWRELGDVAVEVGGETRSAYAVPFSVAGVVACLTGSQLFVRAAAWQPETSCPG